MTQPPLPTDAAIRAMRGWDLCTLLYRLDLAPPDIVGMYTIDGYWDGFCSARGEGRWAPHEDLAQAEALLRLLHARGWTSCVISRQGEGTVFLHKGRWIREYWGALHPEGCSHALALLRCVVLAAVHEAQPEEP